MDNSASLATDLPLTCISCGRPLGDSDDDQPDWPTGPMCGDCYQARQTDDEIWWSEANDTTTKRDARLLWGMKRGAALSGRPLC